MPSNVQIGPFVLPVALLFMFTALAAASFVGRRASRRVGVDVGPALFWSLMGGLWVARLAFVLQFSTAYHASPLAVLDIRDSGWQPLAGLAAAWLFAIAWQFKRPGLRKPLLSAMLAGTAIWGGRPAAVSLPVEERKLPALAFTMLAGYQRRAHAVGRQPMVVNLWATWCPPCVREMPVLHAAQVGNPAVNFVLIDQGESAERVDSWLAARNPPLRNVLPDRESRALKTFDRRGLPTTLFFDAKGRLVSMRTGELSAAASSEKRGSIDRAWTALRLDPYAPPCFHPDNRPAREP